MIPKVGDKIYIRGAMFISHGEDDYCGGIATVSKVSDDGFVSVLEVPNWSFGWISLEKDQEKLKKQYGDQKAHPDPDYSPESNCWD